MHVVGFGSVDEVESRTVAGDYVIAALKITTASGQVLCIVEVVHQSPPEVGGASHVLHLSASFSAASIAAATMPKSLVLSAAKL